MKFITVSELRAYATSIIAEIEATGEEVVVTKHGKPVALVQSVSAEEFRFGKDVSRAEKEG